MMNLVPQFSWQYQQLSLPSSSLFLFLSEFLGGRLYAKHDSSNVGLRDSIQCYVTLLETKAEWFGVSLLRCCHFLAAGEKIRTDSGFF